MSAMTLILIFRHFSISSEYNVFLAVSWVCLHFVIVIYPDHTHLLFFTYFFSSFKITSA